MAYNGSGVWVRLYNWTNDAANGVKIRADRMDAEFNDMCNNGLSAVITRDGQGSASQNQPMNGFKHTGAGIATASGQYLNYGQSGLAFGAAVTAPFGTSGVGLAGTPFTQTDATTSAGTVAAAAASAFGAATFATSANAITITNAYGVFFSAPVAGANVSLSAAWGLGCSSLKSIGNILVGGTLTAQGDGPSSFAFLEVSGDGGASGSLTCTGFGNTGVYSPATISTNSSMTVTAGGSGGTILLSGATGWSSASDEKRKTDLTPITNAVAKLAMLRTITGRYKTDAPEKRRAFLIAQDVQKVLPEAVSAVVDEKSGEKTLHLAYTETIPLIIAAINELSAKL